MNGYPGVFNLKWNNFYPESRFKGTKVSTRINFSHRNDWLMMRARDRLDWIEDSQQILLALVSKVLLWIIVNKFNRAHINDWISVLVCFRPGTNRNNNLSESIVLSKSMIRVTIRLALYEELNSCMRTQAYS